MNPFCPNDGTSYNFYLAKDGTATTGTADNFGCLSTHSGEQWLYIKVDTPGDMKFLTTSTKDHDYAVWGPFASKSAAIARCGSLPAPVDCSFHPQAAEEVNVLSVQSGSVFVMLIANYAQEDQALTTVVAPGNTAGYNCQDPDLLACPLVRLSLDYECGGGTGTYNYQCTPEQIVEEGASYKVYNALPWAYKLAFVSALRFLAGCTQPDLGTTTVACLGLNNSTWILLAANALLLLLLYLSRCAWQVWAVLFVVWLHVDAVMCILDRRLNKRPVAKKPAPPPRSNLELFAYTNNKKGWKEKAYSTFELKKAKKDAKVMKKIERKNSKHKKNLKPILQGGRDIVNMF
ncbi:hypothetical protein TrRE_jg11446 [Triparma retinervis]|uniref:Uncharacterized protein n=1 Tax=Triparma retinervis TaxID=2557542 RepID=A0A9W7L5L2_9STRA|nr:hypothetical protein TrRE_jg11446 [Triparma retinervis]